MRPREAAAETTIMTLKHLGIEKSEWRKILEVPADKLVEAQGTIGRSEGGPLGRHPFDPVAQILSKDRPLLVGYNRDETVFLFNHQGNTEVST